jgi:CRP/FNR family transcriptional regulator, cyclic AMP receptor protein
MTENPRIVGAEPILRGLPPDQITVLAAASQHVSVPAGHRLFEEGAPADRFWIIDAGEVGLDVLVPGHGRRTITMLGRGDVVGLSWLMPPYLWQFGAVCTRPVQAFEFDARAVRAACADNPELGYAVATRFIGIILRRLQSTRACLLQARSAA